MRKACVLLLLLALSACDGRQSMLGADGCDGVLFAGLWQVFLVVTLAFYVVVIAGLAWAMFRRREGGAVSVRTALFAWIGAISVTLVALTLASWFADRNMNRESRPPLTVEITAHQWWWDVRYYGADGPSDILRTANELHLPAGVPVRVILKSSDVIHSFWIPNLSGKQDLIPGRTNDIVITPEKQGLYRGQCAEFCGLQHAHMAFDVTVESPAAFRAWWARGLLPAQRPVTPLQKAGYAYVTTRECSTCHHIEGTPASGLVAPDLTHLASRRSLAAGSYPLDRGHLYAWIADPQGMKPGNKMPYIGLEPQELHAVVAYLESLK
ncbi:MAG: cytochrome c oxidase subunit II [Tsuneonella sp.]